MIKSPYFPLHGLYLDMQSATTNLGIPALTAIYIKAVAVMDKVLEGFYSACIDRFDYDN